MSASLLTQDAREILENRTSLETLVTVLKAALERNDISIQEYNPSAQYANLRIGGTNVYLGNGRITVRDSYGSQSGVDELGDTVQAVTKMLAGRLRSDRVVEAIKANGIPIKSDEMVGTTRIVQVLL